MPYIIEKVKGGYKVKNEKTNKFLSKTPLKLSTVKDQAYAIALNEINKGKIKRFEKGGLVNIPSGYQNFSSKVLNYDLVPVLLQPNEIVIPKKHTAKVKKFLKEENIKLPNL